MPAHSCRSCGAPTELAFSLGMMPLANRYSSESEPEDSEPRLPLDVARCPRCTLVQITETVDPAVLFSDYLYHSSYSDTMLSSSKALVDRLIAERSLNSSDLVVELASNDGYLLQYYRERGIPVLGIEPAENVARIAHEQRQVETWAEFFDEPLAQRLVAQRGPSRIIHANNVLAHVADLNDFVQGIATLLSADGLAVIEVPYVRWLVERGEFDTIYHEHLCYFSVTALVPLLARHGLELSRVEHLPVHGGSLRLFVEPSPGQRDASVTTLLAEEQESGVGSLASLQALANRAHSTKSSLRGMLAELRSDGARIAAYGAAAKGTVLLNFCEVGHEIITYVVDRNVHKQGRLLPGLRIPIRDPRELVEDPPEFLLVLAWNVLDEVMSQQSDFREKGGRFIVPIPEPRILD